MDRYTAEGSQSTVLTTELNSLASGTLSSLSSAFSNDASTERYPLAMVEVYLAAQGSNRSAGSYIVIYLVPEADGTNYGSITDECADNYVWATFSIDDGALAARYLVAHGLPLPPSDMKFAFKQVTGVGSASSGNTVKITPYSREEAA